MGIVSLTDGTSEFLRQENPPDFRRREKEEGRENIMKWEEMD